MRELHEACAFFLASLEPSGGQPAGGAMAVTVEAALHPLQLACASGQAKIQELALGCLHKLVAHAWLHGESAEGGLLAEDDVVRNVRCHAMRVDRCVLLVSELCVGLCAFGCVRVATDGLVW